MKALKLIASVVGTSLILGGCMMPSTGGQTGQQDTTSSETEIRLLQLEEPVEGQETAVIKTSVGTITMVLYADQAPNTVRHFRKLVEEGFYDGKPFFMQEDVKALITGAEDDKGTKGKVATDNGKPLEAEPTANLWHFSGAVSVLAEEQGVFSKKYVADSRFFIVGDISATTDIVEEMKKNEFPDTVIEAYKKRGGLPQYTGAYTVFGQIISGMDVLETVLTTPIDATTNQPEGGIKIESVTLSSYHSGDPVDFTFEEYVPPVITDSSAESSNSEPAA